MEELYKKVRAIRLIVFAIMISSGCVCVFLFLYFIWDFNLSTILNKTYLIQYIPVLLIIFLLSIFTYDVLKKKKLIKSHLDLIKSDKRFSYFKNFLLHNAPTPENLTYDNFRRAYVDFVENKISSAQAREDFYKDLKWV